MIQLQTVCYRPGTSKIEIANPGLPWRHAFLYQEIGRAAGLEEARIARRAYVKLLRRRIQRVPYSVFDALFDAGGAAQEDLRCSVKQVEILLPGRLVQGEAQRDNFAGEATKLCSWRLRLRLVHVLVHHGHGHLVVVACFAHPESV